MKTGMIMDTRFPPDTRVENEAKTLLKKGYDVYLFCIDFRRYQKYRTPAEDPGDKEDYRSEGLEYEIHEGVKVVRMDGSRLLYKLSALAYTVPFFRWMVLPHIRRFIRQTGVDILHIHDMVIAEAVMHANRSFRLPVILDLHENRPEIMKLYRHVQRWPGTWLVNLGKWRQKQRQLMQQADQVILVTDEARELTAETDHIPREKITAVPNVVRISDFVTKAADDQIERLTRGRFTLLYIGDTSLRRGTLTALEAVRLLRNQIPGLQLLFIGSGSEDARLHQYTVDHELAGLVHFEGWQEPSRLPAYIQAADLCLSPLLRNPHHDTTYANKLFQYMAGGKAVIASDCPAQATVVRTEACGLVHKADDAEDLAQAILRLYTDGDVRMAMGQRGQVAVQERWNWESAGRDLITVYRQLFHAEETENV